MSFLDGVVNGVSGFVKDVFNIDDDAPKRAPKADAEPKRSKDLAVDSTTAFERAPRSSVAAGPVAGFSLLDTIVRSERTQVDRGTAAPHVTSRSGPESLASQGTQLRTAARATVFDAATRGTLGTVDSASAMDSDAAAAAANVQKGLDYYASAFGRSGIDGAGSGVDVLINDRTVGEDGSELFQGNGGYFSMKEADGVVRESIHFGTGKSYRADRGLVEQGAMQHADDLTIHELTHGIIRKESGHLGGGANEAGATNEGIADVMAAAATRDWRIGEGMYTENSDYKAMRDISNPDDPTAVHGLWTSMSEVEAERAKDPNGEIEEHWASGVISTAAFRAHRNLGGGDDAWRAVEQVFYDTIDNSRMGDMSFQAVAAGLRTSAATVFGQGSTVHQVFDAELRAAGL